MKQSYNRREFMGLSRAGAAGLVGAAWPGMVLAQIGSAQDPDLSLIHISEPTRRS